jgi:protease I
VAKIAVVVTDGFEDSEYTKPAQAFAGEGHEVVNIGLEAGKTVKGKKESTPVVIDREAGAVSVEQFDALLIPGGHSPDKLRTDESTVKFVKDFVESGKPVFSICHGPQLLITADVLKGRTLTGYKSIIQDIKNAGADFVDKEVVVDRNLVTSRNPSDLAVFIKTALEKIRKG